MEFSDPKAFVLVIKKYHASQFCLMYVTNCDARCPPDPHLVHLRAWVHLLHHHYWLLSLQLFRKIMSGLVTWWAFSWSQVVHISHCILEIAGDPVTTLQLVDQVQLIS